VTPLSPPLGLQEVLCERAGILRCEAQRAQPSHDISRHRPSLRRGFTNSLPHPHLERRVRSVERQLATEEGTMRRIHIGALLAALAALIVTSIAVADETKPSTSP